MNVQLFIFATLLLGIYADYSDHKFQYGESENSEVDGPPGPPFSRRQRPPPIRHFCKCFEHLVGCIKRHRNSSMEMNPEKFAMGEMFHSNPMDFENMEEMTVERKNGSKGNHTGMRKCIHHFMKCVHHRRPGPPEPQTPEEGGEVNQKMAGGFVGKMKGKMKGFFGKLKSKLSGIFNKMKGKYGSKFGGKFGGKFGKRGGKYGKMNHRHHHHHRHHRRGPFFKCFIGAKICKHRAGRSRRKMKRCAKMFAHCILGQCKRGPKRG